MKNKAGIHINQFFYYSHENIIDLYDYNNGLISMSRLINNKLFGIDINKFTN